LRLLGRDWVPRFILRHPHLTVAIGRRIESVRMDRATKEVLNAWFDAYKKVVQDCKITQGNTYNMDESGFSIGTMESTLIILDSTLRTKHQAHPGRQEWVSMVECICADGTILPPLGIFKGKNVLQNWIPNEVLEQWFFSANTKGWTSNLHGLEWLKRVFEPLTRTKANGQYRLLIQTCQPWKPVYQPLPASFGKDSHVEKASNWTSYRITNVPRSITVIGDLAEVTPIIQRFYSPP
jgi:hypothetical protein